MGRHERSLEDRGQGRVGGEGGRAEPLSMAREPRCSERKKKKKIKRAALRSLTNF